MTLLHFCYHSKKIEATLTHDFLSEEVCSFPVLFLSMRGEEILALSYLWVVRTVYT